MWVVNTSILQDPRLVFSGWIYTSNPNPRISHGPSINSTAMKPNDEELDGKIDALLAEWQESIEVPQDFKREVWRRVELSGPCHHGLLERLAWWLLRPMRELALLVLVMLVATIWGLTHPPQAEHSPHDAYLLSISPFDPHHYASLLR